MTFDDQGSNNEGGDYEMPPRACSRLFSWA